MKYPKVMVYFNANESDDDIQYTMNIIRNLDGVHTLGKVEWPPAPHTDIWLQHMLQLLIQSAERHGTRSSAVLNLLQEAEEDRGNLVNLMGTTLSMIEELRDTAVGDDGVPDAHMVCAHCGRKHPLKPPYRWSHDMPKADTDLEVKGRCCDVCWSHYKENGELP